MSDYVLGGRRLGSFMTALSAGSSTTSAWTMLALPGLAFSGGLVEMWIPIGAVVSIGLSWTLLAGRLRRFTIAANDALTIPEFYAARFGDRGGILRTLTSLLTIVFVVFYVSSGLIGGSKLLETIFGIEAGIGIVLTLLAVASYTLIGGFLAVSRTDVFQALLMLFGLLLITVALAAAGSASAAALAGSTPAFFDPLTGGGAPISVVFILSVAGWGFGAFGSQRILQRFMALEQKARVGVSRNISLAWLVAVYGLALAVGLLARPALAEAGLLAEVADPERIYLVVSEAFFHPAIAGLLLTAVIAAVMSTADSQLLLASAVATGDLPPVSEIAASITARARVWLGRALLLVSGLIGLAVALLFPDSIFALVSYAWGGMGAAFGPVTLLALYWRRFNFWGALASTVSGTLVATIWAFSSGGPGGMLDIQPATPGFAIGLLVGILVTLLTPAPAGVDAL